MHTNPYVAGPPVRAPYFYGRARLLDELADPRYTCYYLVGIRRVGKTSLLQAMVGAAPSGVVPLFANLQRAVGHESKLDTQRFSRVLLQTAKRQGREQFDLAEMKAATELVERIEALAWAAEAAGLTVWLLWDETELLADLSPGVLMALRAVLQECSSLHTVLAASKGLGGLNDRAHEWQVSPFLFGFATRFISPLSEEEAGALIAQRDHPDGPVDVSFETINTLLSVCGGHPYLLQALCLRLYQPNARRLRAPTPRDIDLVLHEEKLSDVFQQDYDNLSPSERVMLRRLAQGDADKVQLARRVVLSPEGTLSLLVALTRLGLVQEMNGTYRIGNEMLGRWLRSGLVEERATRLSDQASLEVVERTPYAKSAGLNTSVEGSSMSNTRGFSHGYALLIGVGRYKDDSLSVPGPDQDAIDVGHILKHPNLCAFPESQVIVLTNEDANKTRILAELDAVKDQVQRDSNSTVIIFFSGHGWQQDGYYFLPYETEILISGGKLHVKTSTVLTNEDFLNKVRQIPAQRLVILFNTCFAGGVGTSLAPEMTQFAPVPLGLYDKLLEGSGRVIISSSKADEKSWIKGGTKNSLFTTHLLSALQGQGVETSGNTVRVFDVFDHLSKAVPADASTINVVQTPVLKAYDVTQNFPIALLLGGKGLSPDSAMESPTVSISGPGIQIDEPTKMDRKQKQKLVDALLACPTMRDRNTRDVVVDELPGEMRNSIRRNSVDRVDVSNIVARCLDFPHGIEELIEILRGFEGSSIGMQQVVKVMD